MAKSTATTQHFADLDPQYADAELCPGLSAMRGIYSLLIACRRNGGKRTCHTFRNVDSTILRRMVETAEKEGFACHAQPDGSSHVAVSVTAVGVQGRERERV